MSFLCPANDNCKYDIAVNMLKKVFGDEYINAITGATTTLTKSVEDNMMDYPIQLAVHNLGIMAMAIISIIVLWVIFSRLALTARTGTPFMEGENVATLIRPIYALVMVMPVKFGYPLVAHAMLMLVMISNGFNNMMFQQQNTYALKSPFMFEQKADQYADVNSNRDIKYVTGQGLRSVGALKDANRLKESAYLGAIHGYCLKHYHTQGFNSFAHLKNPSINPRIGEGLISVGYLDESQKGRFAQAWSAVTRFFGGTPSSGSSNPICGEFTVDVLTVSELEDQLNQGDKHPNATVAMVLNKSNKLREMMAVQGLAVHNSRAVDMAQAYVLGMDYAIGQTIINDKTHPVTLARNDVRVGLARGLYKALGTPEQIRQMGQKSENVLTSAHKAVQDKKDKRAEAFLTGEYNYATRIEKFMKPKLLAMVGGTHGVYSSNVDYSSANIRYGLGFIFQGNGGGTVGSQISVLNAGDNPDGWQFNDTDGMGQEVKVSPAMLEKLFAVVEQKLEPSLDYIHYQIIGNTNTINSQPNLTDFNDKSKDIQKILNQEVHARGWIYAPTSRIIASRLRQEIGDRVISKPISGKIFAMDERVELDREDSSDKLNQAVSTLEATIGALNDRASQYSTEYIGTGLKQQATFGNVGSFGANNFDDKKIANFMDTSIIMSMERAMLNALTGGASPYSSKSVDVLGELQVVGDIALGTSVIIGTIETGVKYGASISESKAAIMGDKVFNTMSAIRQLAYNALAPMLQEAYRFFDNVHTMFSVMPLQVSMVLGLAVLGFLIQAIVAMLVSVPFMILHALPDTQFIGRNTQIYLLAINILVTPILILLGYLMTTGILNAIIPVLIEIWQVSKANNAGNYSSGVFQFMSMILSMKKSWYVLGGTLVAVVHVVSSLAQELPEKVNGFLNIVIPTLSALNSDRFLGGLSNQMASEQHAKMQKLAKIKESNQAWKGANQERLKEEIAKSEETFGSGSNGGGGSTGGQSPSNSGVIPSSGAGGTGAGRTQALNTDQAVRDRSHRRMSVGDYRETGRERFVRGLKTLAFGARAGMTYQRGLDRLEPNRPDRPSDFFSRRYRR